MLSTLDLRGGSRRAMDLRNIGPRAKFDLDSVVEVVRPIVADVRERGVVAVQEWSAKFDGVTAPEIRVPQAVIDDALSNVEQKIRAALEEAIRRVRIVHEQQRRLHKGQAPEEVRPQPGCAGANSRSPGQNPTWHK